jgi:hypothetical protein
MHAINLWTGPHIGPAAREPGERCLACTIAEIGDGVAQDAHLEATGQSALAIRRFAPNVGLPDSVAESNRLLPSES